MRINLGDEFTPNLKDKINWIKTNIDKEHYVIRDIGFLYNDYAVEFTDEKYATLFFIKYPKQ